jgi:thiosulfate/3-mercaptopyruvate sulfurtransferase
MTRLRHAALAAAILSSSLSASRPAVAQTAGPIVSLEWLHAHAGDANVVVIATGDRDEFEAGHIPGAGFVAHDDTLGAGHHPIPPAAAADLFSRAGASDTARIVIYGDDPMTNGWLYLILASAGHADHTSLLDGNIRAWRAAGYPVVKDSATATRGRLTVKSGDSIVVDAPWVRARLNDPHIQLLDVRSDQEWKDGMIPGAERFRWEDLYTDVGAGRFKSPQALRELFERNGVTGGKTAVAYCMVGMRASLAYFAARAAGLPALVYQGSWHDWTTHADYPTTKPAGASDRKRP